MLVAVGLNKNSFCPHVQLPPFGTKINLRENRFFRQDERLVDKKGTHGVKFLTEKLTKADELTSGQVNELIVRLIMFWHKHIHFDIRT